MKTLILNGSPRSNGDTASLLNVITQNITGEYRIVNAYGCDISPCIDCISNLFFGIDREVIGRGK